MNRLLPVALILAACTAQQAANTTTTIAKICAAAQPLVVAASASSTSLSAKAAALAPYVTAACNADGTVAASLAPNVNGTTPVWLTTVLTDFSTVAGIVLPALPALLAL